MPLRNFKALTAGRCPLCRDEFEQYLPAGSADITECPRCGATVAPSGENTVNSPRITRPIGTVEAKDAGFTVMERNKHGLYEKQ